LAMTAAGASLQHCQLGLQSQACAQVVLKVEDVNANIDFFKDQLLFKVLGIFPADSPRVAVLTGYGLTLRLERETPSAPGIAAAAAVHLRVVMDSEFPADTELTLNAPCGVLVDLVKPDGDTSAEATEVPSLEASVAISSHVDGDFLPGRAGMQYRDLVPDRQGGFVIASHITIPRGGPVPDYVHFHKVRFQMIFCFKGWVRVVYEDQGEPFVMHAGDCVLQAPTIRHRVLESSEQLEVVEVSCPSEHETLTDHALALPTGSVQPDRIYGGGQRFARHDAAKAHFEADSLWPGFESSDFGLLAASNGVGSARVVRRTTAAPAVVVDDETRWITSAPPVCAEARGEEEAGSIQGSSCRAIQLAFLLSGSATLQYRQAGQGGSQDMVMKEEELKATASFTLPQGMLYRLVKCSEDFAMLQVTINEG